MFENNDYIQCATPFCISFTDSNGKDQKIFKSFNHPFDIKIFITDYLDAATNVHFHNLKTDEVYTDKGEIVKE